MYSPTWRFAYVYPTTDDLLYIYIPRFLFRINNYYYHCYCCCCSFFFLSEFKKEQVELQIVDTGRVKVSGERLTEPSKYVRFEQTYKVPENADLKNVTGKFDGETLYVTFPKQAAVDIKRDDTATASTRTTGDNKKNVDVGAAAREKEKTQEVKPHEDEEVAMMKKKTEEERCGSGGSETKKKEEKAVDGKASIRFSEEYARRLWEEEEGGYLRRAMTTFCQNKGIIATAVLAISLGLLVSRRFQPPSWH